MDLLLTAREVSAQEAKEIGLIGRVVPDGTALEAALEIAEVIGANGPLAVEAIKASVKATEGIPEAGGPQDRAGVRLAHLRHRGRQGGPEGVRREASARLPAPVTETRGRAAALEARSHGVGWPTALRQLIDLTVSAVLDDGTLDEAAEAVEAISTGLARRRRPGHGHLGARPTSPIRRRSSSPPARSSA